MTAAIGHRRILKIALPIVVSNATVPILGAVDTGVVGQLGLAAPIGAVAIGAVILSSVYWVFSFLRMGTTGLTSQAAGAGDRAEVAALLSRVLMIGAAAGVLLIAIQSPLLAAAFRLSPASPEVEAMAHEYTAIRVWSAPAAIALFGINGWLIALERTRAVLVIQLWMNGLNIALDLWFVLGLGWGVGGVAFATFLAEWSGLAVALVLARDAFGSPAWRDWPRIFDRVRLKRMALVNTDIMIRSVLLMTTATSFTLLGATFGDLTLAANQILLQFVTITAYALDGFAFAAEAIVGQSMGRGDRAGFRRGAILVALWGAGAGLALSLVFLIAGGAIIDAMATASDVRLEARRYLPWMVVAPLLGTGAWMLDGIFIGATRTRDMRDMAALSLAIYVAAVVVLMPLWGNHGLWAALSISFVARGITLWTRYPALERSIGG